MSIITNLIAREVMDSRGNPTVYVAVYTQNDLYGEAMVPSGASTGAKEAIELRDGDPSRYHGKGVLKAVENICGPIRDAFIGRPVEDLQGLDKVLIDLDATDNKSKLGANAILAVSMACARVMSMEANISLYQYFAQHMGVKPSMPVPMMNILNGGVHTNNGLDIQEFMIVPVGAKNISEAVRCGAEIFHVLKNTLQTKGYSTAVGDEGGFSPILKRHELAMDFLMHAIKDAGYQPGVDVFLALDIASSEFYKNGKYHLQSEGRVLDSASMVALLKGWVEQYPLISIEDGLAEDDYAGWQLLTRELGEAVQLVGDDLFVTQTGYLQEGIQKKMGNAVLVKINQVGSISETLATMEMASKHRYANVVSHRSGETEDSFIADLAVGTAAGQIKTGSLSRSERTAKYNRLMLIESELGGKIAYAGMQPFQHLKNRWFR